jgi:UDP-N-acetylmuramate dehydrogenase
MLPSQLRDKWEKHLLQHEPLAKYTAARVGGPADWLYIARKVDLLGEIVSDAWNAGIPVRVMGGGANVLVADSGIRGLVVINRANKIEMGDWHDGRTVAAASGTGLALLANRCQSNGLSGMEWAVSVPGTVGGAIVNNAGAHGEDMSDSVADVAVLEKSGPKLYTVHDLAYDYRYSALKARQERDFLVLLATFILPPDDKSAIKARMAANITHRRETQPPGASLGSIFKNPPGDYAGRLIEAAGLKGHQIGNAVVSPVHANFILNAGGVRAADYYALIYHVRDAVEKHSGVRLELEIELIGDWESG